MTREGAGYFTAPTFYDLRLFAHYYFDGVLDYDVMIRFLLFFFFCIFSFSASATYYSRDSALAAVQAAISSGHAQQYAEGDHKFYTYHSRREESAMVDAFGSSYSCGQIAGVYTADYFFPAEHTWDFFAPYQQCVTTLNQYLEFPYGDNACPQNVPHDATTGLCNATPDPQHCTATQRNRFSGKGQIPLVVCKGGCLFNMSGFVFQASNDWIAYFTNTGTTCTEQPGDNPDVHTTPTDDNRGKETQRPTLTKNPDGTFTSNGTPTGADAGSGQGTDTGSGSGSGSGSGNSDGSSSSSDDCLKPPPCGSSDPVQCAQLAQIYNDMCYVHKFDSGKDIPSSFTTDNDPHSLYDSNSDIGDELNNRISDVFSGSPSGSTSCFADKTFTALGQTYTLEMQPFCNLATSIAPIFTLIFTLLSASIIIRAVVGGA